MTELLKQQITKLQNRNELMLSEISEDRKQIQEILRAVELKDRTVEENNYLISLYKKELNK